ncbi:MAG: hypothetical protein JW909_03845 [Planctomycetes bacterium]|nr:hypothetical protein [Planctomycetota bacterium]
MKKYIGLSVGGVVVLALVGYLVYDRFILTDEVRVRRVVEDLEKTLEEHDIIAFGDHISADYVDEWGYGAAELKQIIMYGMKSFQQIEVDITEMKIEVEGTGATAVFYPACRLSSDSGGTFDVDTLVLHGDLLKLSLRKVDRAWRVCRSERVPEEN